MTLSADLIAELHFTLVHPDGRREPGRIWVARPTVIDERESRCAVGVDGLQPLPPISGSDTLQAMLLGLRMVQRQIADFMAKGGRLRYPDDSEPLGLDPYFGALVSPRAAFPDLEWGQLDVDGIVSASGIAVVRPSHRQRCARLFAYEEYGTFAIDCALGKQSVLEQLGRHLKWQEQFGYQLEDGEGNLDALRDGFEFAIPESGRFVLELLEPEMLWRENERWFDGLLAIASEHSRRQLALGRRFFTVLFAEESSPLIGRVVDNVSIPFPWTPPKRPYQSGVP
jgi:hypothetical protein